MIFRIVKIFFIVSFVVLIVWGIKQYNKRNDIKVSFANVGNFSFSNGSLSQDISLKMINPFGFDISVKELSIKIYANGFHIANVIKKPLFPIFLKKNNETIFSVAADESTKAFSLQMLQSIISNGSKTLLKLDGAITVYAFGFSIPKSFAIQEEIGKL